MVTMHDLLDAQWVYDNTKDGKCGQPVVDCCRSCHAATAHIFMFVAFF